MACAVISDKPLIAYLHDLSPIKKSQRDNMYFHMTLQTEHKTYRSVCFSPEKHQNFSAKYESSSPLKISKFQIKRNERTNEDEVHINKRTKMEDPLDSEICFDIRKVEAENKCKPGITTVAEVLEGDTNAVVNISGRITFTSEEETVFAKGKTLRKREALFTDNSGTIRLVLWENDIDRVTSASMYNICKVVVREYENVKYLTLNKSSIIKSANISVTRKDGDAGLPNTEKVDCPAEGVLSVQRFSSCKKCRTKLIPNGAKPLVKCTECGLAQLINKCQQRLIANVMFLKDGNNISLLLFEDKLKQVYDIYKNQFPEGATGSFESLDDDSLMEMLLTVEATVCFNKKKNVVSVHKKK